ncbi:MAG: single-stranded-DNA-specific exonuclease RecJ [Phycisphaerales bacterium]|nr:single-stranded-DNA-specific exonuclease RecJ [Phycisphaerales bacterium]
MTTNVIELPSPTSTSSGDASSVRGLTKVWRMRAAPTITMQIGAPASAPGPGNVPPLVQRVLHARGLDDPQQIKRFCNPKLTDLHDPGLLPNIDVAAARIIDAIRRDELIAIYGDYDVDGISATAILYHIIKGLQPNARLRCHVPHRLDEGYGLNADALRQLKTEGVDLAISVDCGITAIVAAQTAREIGLDLIITDHHDLPDPALSTQHSALPQALAIVHPRLPGSQYPFGDLCGAGVAFKLGWRLATMWCNSQRVSQSLQHLLIDLLPLAALATIADVVPLTGENRIITTYGLRFIKQTPLIGLRALIEASGLMEETIDSQKVGFVLGPRLNACGRMGHAADAVGMLTDAPADQAAAMARQLTQMNQQRQAVERAIVDQASFLAESQGMTGDDRRAIVLAHESWHQGVVGIVCARMVDRFSRPVILLQRQGDVCKGSARSIDGYSIHAALASAQGHLLAYGGHAMAAGLTLSAESLEPFRQALTAHANRNISIDQLAPSITVDCDAPLAEIDAAAVHGLMALGPFGRGNREPAIRIRNAVVAQPPQQMGSNGRHLALQVRQEAAATNRPGAWRWLRAVWWGAGQHAAALAPGMTIDLVIEPKINTWNGRINVEADVYDLRIAGTSAPS